MHGQSNLCFSSCSPCLCHILARSLPISSNDPAPRGALPTSSFFSYRVAWTEASTAAACVSVFLVTFQLQYDIMHPVHIESWAQKINVRHGADQDLLAMRFRQYDAGFRASMYLLLVSIVRYKGRGVVTYPQSCA